MHLRAVLYAAITLICLSATAEAHQPRLVTGSNTEVTKPEVSQAFYAQLTGSAQKYIIDAAGRFRLYVQLTIPDYKGVRHDFTVTISRGKKLISKLDGGRSDWKPFYEPFGGDNYLLGPEFDEADSAPGEYSIVVSNRGNTGKYVLVFGKKEEFPAKEILRTISIMPKVKEFMRGPSEPQKADDEPLSSPQATSTP